MQWFCILLPAVAKWGTSHILIMDAARLRLRSDMGRASFAGNPLADLQAAL